MRRSELRSLALITALCVTCAPPPLPTQRPAPLIGMPDVTIGLTRDPALAAAIADISAARIRETDSALVSFGTRHTMSDTLSPTQGSARLDVICSTSCQDTAGRAVDACASNTIPRCSRFAAIPIVP